MPSQFLLLLFFSPFLICHVAAGATEEADRLMNLLKSAIELNNIHSLRGFIAPEFTYNTCHGVLTFDQFQQNLEVLSVPPKAVSTDWSTRDARIVNGVLQFVLHYNDQFPVAYADIEYEAKQFGNNDFMLTKGKSMTC